MIAALSALCAVPLDVVDRLMPGDRTDPVLILCKADEPDADLAPTAIPEASGTDQPCPDRETF